MGERVCVCVSCVNTHGVWEEKGGINHEACKKNLHSINTVMHPHSYLPSHLSTFLSSHLPLPPLFLSSLPSPSPSPSPPSLLSPPSLSSLSPLSPSLPLTPTPLSLDPAIVGKAFVKQYYTQMHKDPSQMHRFYLDQSSFVHGGAEMGSEEPVIGQKVCLLV